MQGGGVWHSKQTQKLSAEGQIWMLMERKALSLENGRAEVVIRGWEEGGGSGALWESGRNDGKVQLSDLSMGAQIDDEEGRLDVP